MKIIILCIILVGMLFLMGCQIECPECEEFPEEKALLTLVIDTAYINEDKIDEIFFSYSIINYGYKEAKNVEVACILYDENDEIVFRVNDNIGNVASTSIIYQETYGDFTLKEEDLFWQACTIISCDDCDVLIQRIPSMKDILDDYFKRRLK